MNDLLFYDLYCATYKIKQVKLNYSNDKPLKNQILFSFKNIKLLSVCKTYSSTEYLGVTFLFAIDHELLKVFRDVAMGFSEDIVEDLDKLLTFKRFLGVCQKIRGAYVNNQKVKVESFDFIHNKQSIKCEKIFLNDIYCFSNFHSPNAISRGAYSGKIFTGGNPFDKINYSPMDHEGIISYYTDKSCVGLSNTYTYVSTEYSTINPKF